MNTPPLALTVMKILDFALTLGKLKQTKRTGWVRENIPNPESIAEHSFRTAVLTMILAPKIEADSTKAIKMALVHDIGEAKIGDIVTARGKHTLENITDKIEKEKEAISLIFSPISGDEYIELFNEFDANLTKEAKLVNQVDKLEMAIQALEYEQGHKVNLQEFFDYADTKIVDQEIKEILQQILKMRNK